MRVTELRYSFLLLLYVEQGFCCLMQISTRKEDIIIDALKLRSHLSKLESVFGNKDIVKVKRRVDFLGGEEEGRRGSATN